MAELHEMFKSVAIRILVIPPAMVLTWALLLGSLSALAGISGVETARDFVRDAAGPMALLQAKMCLVWGGIAILFG